MKIYHEHKIKHSYNSDNSDNEERNSDYYDSDDDSSYEKVLDGWVVRVHDSTTYCTRIRQIITQINSFERLGRKNYVAGERKAIADFLSTNQQIEARIVDHWGNKEKKTFVFCEVLKIYPNKLLYNCKQTLHVRREVN